MVMNIKLREKLDQAKIYKIIDNTNGNEYIGSTCQSLKRRLSIHKSGYKRFLNGLGYNVKSFDIIKNDDYKIELIENCDIKTKQELISQERFFIENNECINKVIPGRTDKEYKEDNKDKIKESSKNYYIDNKDKIKLYREDNKDRAKAYNKNYRIVNKDKIKIQTNEKFDCECGGKYIKTHKSRHLKSLKHQKFIKKTQKTQRTLT